MLFACTLFEPWICERRLTLDLHHKVSFAKTSKPLQPRTLLSNDYSKFNKFVWNHSATGLFIFAAKLY